MSFSHKTLAALAAAVVLVSAGFDASSQDNIAIYWGQNSANGASTQSSLVTYCANTEIDIIPLAFLTGINTPAINFAGATNNCGTLSGSSLPDCSSTIGADITTCQSTYGKTILLSVGGATYAEGGFTSSDAAATAAETLWAMFGPVQSGSSAARPFGSAVVDGFDFDFESETSNMATFGSTLRSKMDAETAVGGKTYYLSAAPQCVYPDAADNDMLAGTVSFDFIMIQFYNNYCGLNAFVSGSSSQTNFNYATWDNWAKTVSKNPNVKLLIGAPANSASASTGYVDASTLSSIVTYAKTFSSFGGVMIWDMSQVYQNSGFLDSLTSAMGKSSSSSSSATTTAAAVPTTLTTMTKTAAGSSSTGVAQWDQCGGAGFSGSTTCASGLTCTYVNANWSSCQ